jgi:hypothetical protein
VIFRSIALHTNSFDCDKIPLLFHRLFPVLLCALLSFAQTKKIIVEGADAATLKEHQSITPKARVIGVTAQTVMQEIGDADAFISMAKTTNGLHAIYILRIRR